MSLSGVHIARLMHDEAATYSARLRFSASVTRASSKNVHAAATRLTALDAQRGTD